MKIFPADPAVPLFGPDGTRVDPAVGVEADDNDFFWHRRIRGGEAVVVSGKAAEARAKNAKPE